MKRARWWKPRSIRPSSCVEKADGFYLHIRFDKAWAEQRTRKLVTTDLLGKAVIANLRYEGPDGTPIRIDSDYFGKATTNPTPGPFESPGQGELELKVW